jgi:hypothetical protein
LAGRRIEEAIDAFLSRTRRSTACLTNQPVIAIRTPAAGHVYEAVFAPRSSPARLQAETVRRTVLFRLTLSFEIVQPDDPRHEYATRVLSYEYRLLDREEREVMAFHWHPIGLSDVTDPHIHLSSQLNPIEMGRDQEPLALADMHILTGFVTLEDVVRLLISEFSIRPRHADWDATLRENRSLALAEQAS